MNYDDFMIIIHFIFLYVYYLFMIYTNLKFYFYLKKKTQIKESKFNELFFL